MGSNEIRTELRFKEIQCGTYDYTPRDVSDVPLKRQYNLYGLTEDGVVYKYNPRCSLWDKLPMGEALEES